MYPAFIATWPSPSNMFNETVGKAAIIEHWIAFSDTMTNPTDYVNIDISSFQFFATAFFFCTKTLSCNVELGVPHISEVSSTVNIISSPVEFLNIQWNKRGDIFFDNGTCNLGGKSMVLGGSTGLTTETYTVDVCTGLMLSDAFFYMTSGWYTTTNAILFSQHFAFAALDTGPMSQAFGLALFGGYPTTPVIKDPAIQLDNVRHMMENVAGGMTNALVYLIFASLTRPDFACSLQKAGSMFPGSSGTVEGIAYQPQTIVQVRWAWLSLLPCYVIIAAIFLASIILWSYASGTQTLKRSSLAMMVAIDRSTKEELGTLDRPSNLEEKAKDISMTLGSGHLVTRSPSYLGN